MGILFVVSHECCFKLSDSEWLVFAAVACRGHNLRVLFAFCKVRLVFRRNMNRIIHHGEHGGTGEESKIKTIYSARSEMESFQVNAGMSLLPRVGGAVLSALARTWPTLGRRPDEGANLSSA